MNNPKKALATKTNNKANSMKGCESFGFKRYLALPNKMVRTAQLSHYLAGNSDESFIKTIRDFLGAMTEQEYKNWIMTNI